MGSGETSPTMVTAHQQCLVGVSADRAVFLDTPFGFQENADDLSEKILTYFRDSVGSEIRPLQLRTADTAASQVADVHASVANAQWVFTGPGSPSYTLKIWQQVGLGSAFEKMLEQGTLVAASAAALTIGSHTLPVYEVYKVGDKPHWLKGMNLLEIVTGLRAAVVPHFNNNDGTNHDTRFCYMGEQRMRQLESELPADTFILGVDEHSGVRLDLDSSTAFVFGKGGMTIRKGKVEQFFESGSEVSFAEIVKISGVERAPESVAAVSDKITVGAIADLISEGEIETAVAAVIDANNSENAEDRIQINSAIRMIGNLAARPQIDRTEIVRPLVEAILQARVQARADKRWADSDQLRDALIAAGIEVQDTADGTNWQIAE